MIQIFLTISLLFYVFALIFVILKTRYGYLPIFFSLYFIFILIIPAYFHVYNNVFPFYGLSYSYDYQLDAAIVLTVFTSFFWMGFFLNKGRNVRVIEFLDRTVDSSRFFISIWLIILLLVLCLAHFGIGSFIVKRSDFSRDTFGSNSSIVELIISFMRWGSFSLIFYLLVFRKHVHKLFWIVSFLFSIIIFFIINFPLALPRFVFFSYLISLFCFFRTSNVKNKFIVVLLFSLGVTTIFPYFSFITRGEGDFSDVMNNYYQSSGDFDGFQSIINVVEFVSNKDYTYGNQILSALFSFIPRSIWEGKSDPTGSVTASAAGYDYLNISSPLPAEFYVDFGYLGLILFSFFLGLFFRKIDKYYILSDRINLKYLLSILFIALVPILSRGALLAVINNLYAVIIVFTLMYYIIFLKVKL